MRKVDYIRLYTPTTKPTLTTTAFRGKKKGRELVVVHATYAPVYKRKKTHAQRGAPSRQTPLYSLPLSRKTWKNQWIVLILMIFNLTNVSLPFTSSFLKGLLRQNKKLAGCITCCTKAESVNWQKRTEKVPGKNTQPLYHFIHFCLQLTLRSQFQSDFSRFFRCLLQTWLPELHAEWHKWEIGLASGRERVKIELNCV